MKTETFVDKVKRHFDFLETQYGLKIVFAKNSEIRPYTDGVLKYASKFLLFIIDSETGQPALRFVRSQDDERFYLDPVSIHEYLTTNGNEKQILLSQDERSRVIANEIVSKKYLLSSPGWKSEGKNIYEDLDKRIMNYANWVKGNIELYLSGDFSGWPEMYEYKINRLIADEIRRGGKGIVKAVIKDEKGVLSSIERPIFQRELEHLHKLKKEVLGE
jgi:hypothetical protein